jgi:PAS domain S-box-containing protein
MNMVSVGHATPERGEPRAEDHPYSRRLVASSVIFVAAQAIILAIAFCALYALNIARAYSTGEAHYSKAQKEAVISLTRYIDTKSERDYEKFETMMTVLLAYSGARQALEHDPLDAAGARRHFLLARNDPDDITALIVGFACFQRLPQFAEAVGDWRAADVPMVSLQNVARALRAGIHSGEPQTTLEPRIREAQRLDADLSSYELSFSDHMGVAARWLQTVVYLLLGFTGLLVGVTGGVRLFRITKENVESEMRARSGELRIRDFAALASDWFGECDRDFRIAYLSDSFVDLMGAPIDELVEKDWREFLRTDTNEQERCKILSALDKCEPFFGYRMVRQGGDGVVRHWSISGKPIFAANGLFDGYRFIGRDISADVRANEELTCAKALAESASRSKSTFLANMSHELRTPLNAILGFSEIIRDGSLGASGATRHREFAAHINDAGSHLLNLINDVLDMSKIEAGKMELHLERLDFNELVYDCTTLMRVQCEKAGVELSIDNADDSLWLSADRRAIKQILLNLISNAVKFTPAGGCVTVSTKIGDANCSLCVADTGFGIPAEDIARLSTPFFQVRDTPGTAHKGTGLGLTLVRALAEMHGGSMAIESAVGTGTRVTILIPTRSREAVAA